MSPQTQVLAVEAKFDGVSAAPGPTEMSTVQTKTPKEKHLKKRKRMKAKSMKVQNMKAKEAQYRESLAKLEGEEFHAQDKGNNMHKNLLIIQRSDFI